MSAPFDRHTDLDLGGGPLRAYEAGEAQAPPLVLLHGAMLDSAEFTWFLTARRFAERHRVIALDLPRHGASRPWPETLDRDAMARIVAEALGRLGLERVPVVGLSLGGAVAIDVALRHPERVSKLVLCAPGGLEGERRGQFATWLFTRAPWAQRLTVTSMARMKDDSFAQAIAHTLADGEHTPHFDELVELARRELMSKRVNREPALDDWQRLAFGPFGMRYWLLDDLDELGVPSLWLRGEADPLVDQEPIERAARRAGGELRVVTQARHVVPLDQPQTFAELTEAFLDRA